MDNKLNDVISKKKSVIFVMIAIMTAIPFILSRFFENIWIDSAISIAIQLSYFFIYVGIILVLISSVTWKWKKITDKKSAKCFFVERKLETKEEEFQRRRVFAFGVFLSIYGAFIQATNSFASI